MSVIKSVIIVGGGTAGWLTAARLAYDHKANDANGLSVTLIESPSVPSLGVGEGTWPTLRATLREVGVSELEFIKECDVSFKQGSKFVGWNKGSTDDVYYHPFTPPEGAVAIDVNYAWLKHRSDISFAHAFSAQAVLCDRGLAPKQVQTPEYAAFSNYGYHLDADKFGFFLKKHCTEKLGVKYIQANLTEIEKKEDGYISALHCSEGRQFLADLFIDCSGAKGLLIKQYMGAEYKSCRGVLFNDCALAVHVPYGHKNENISSTTTSTAQKNGWIWDIPLQSRRGVGYVYSSQHIDQDSAHHELMDYVTQTALSIDKSSLSVKSLSFDPGYCRTPWLKNCIAVGMSAGFVEPLEASAIAMVEICSKTISNELPADRTSMGIVAKRFNKRFVERWDSIVDFLKLHYWLSDRIDSQYWLDNKEKDSISERLQDLLKLWEYQIPSTADFHLILELFGPPSYQYVLYGMGFKPRTRQIASVRDNDAIAMNIFARVSDAVTKGLRGLPTNRELLNQLGGNEFSDRLNYNNK